ncbi:MAG: transposase [Gammaproteobacteria bacterium]|nr:MAG: transposase [Gammaproteobacteria bacterium]
MGNYKRLYIEGSCYFFTVVTKNRENILTTPKSIEILRKSFSSIKRDRPFIINAIVVLPDHLHCIWTLPKDDSDFSNRWKIIKGNYTRSINRIAGRNNARSVWQPRFWEHRIRDENDYLNHVNYIHFNPVKHQYVENPADWLFSSFHAFVKEGYYEIGWGNSISNEVMKMNFE